MPTPFGTAQYWHRNLNPKKLVEVRFSFKPANQNMAQFVKLHRLANEPFTKRLRPMTENDVSAVTVALNKHLNDNYKVHITFSENEVHHFLLPKQNVVWSYVVDDTDGNVTDFISFYALNS